MATPQAIQAEIDPASGKHVANIIRSTVHDATFDAHYVVGITAPYAGKAKWIHTTTAETAANQAAEIVAALVL